MKKNTEKIIIGFMLVVILSMQLVIISKIDNMSKPIMGAMGSGLERIDRITSHIHELRNTLKEIREDK